MTSLNLKIKPVTGINFNSIRLREGCLKASIQSEVLSMKTMPKYLNEKHIKTAPGIHSKQFKGIVCFQMFESVTRIKDVSQHLPKNLDTEATLKCPLETTIYP